MSTVLGRMPVGRAAVLDAQLATVTFAAFFLAAFLPFVTPVSLGTDTQPYAALLAVVLTAAGLGKPLRGELVLLFVPFLASLLVLGITGVTFTGLRGVFGYMSIATIACATYMGMRWDRELFRRIFELAIWLWFAAGALEVVFGPYIFAPILPDVRTNAIRGVTGLAAEPSMYGLQCAAMLLLVLMEFEGKKRKHLATLLVIQILLFGRSSLGALVIFGMLGLHILTLIRSARRLAIAALVAALAVVGLVVLARLDVFGLAQSRLFRLAELFVRNPVYFFVVDSSVNNRLSNIVLSFYGFFDSWMVPQGYGSFAAYVRAVAPRFPTLLPHPSDMERIMSGYGAPLFELGIIGLVIPAVITVLFWKRYKQEPRHLILYATTFSLMMLTQVPLANPIVGLTAGYLAYTHHLRVRTDVTVSS